jgi:hypothetical protein
MFRRENVLSGKCFGGKMFWREFNPLGSILHLFHDLPVDCTAPFEASFVTDAAVDGTAATIANSNRGDPDISGMVLRHLASLIFCKKPF